MKAKKIEQKFNQNNTTKTTFLTSLVILVTVSLAGIVSRSSPSLAITSPLPSCVRVSSRASTGGQYRTIVVTNNCTSSYYAKFKVVSDLPGVPPPNRSCICLFPKQSKTLTVPAKFHLEGCSLPTSCPW
jgi:hypothetical protein